MGNVSKKDKKSKLTTLEFMCNGYYAKSQQKATYTIELSVADEYILYFNNF